jgi:hypothetical protein
VPEKGDQDAVSRVQLGRRRFAGAWRQARQTLPVPTASCCGNEESAASFPGHNESPAPALRQSCLSTAEPGGVVLCPEQTVRRMATRYEKLAAHHLATVTLAAMVILLRELA